MRHRDRDIFNPAHYSKVSLPLEECEGLPRWCFTSEEFYDREVDRIFLKTWIFIGRADEVANPGDYFTAELAGEPIIIIRDRKNVLHALGNTCQHRGARLLTGKGRCKGAITCPYHAWSYDITGALIAAPAMNKTKNFNMSEWGLPEIRLEIWDGFIFVNFDRDAISLMEYLGDLPQQFAPYNFSDMVLTRRVEYDLDCNWKIYAENSTEIYHTAVVHKSSLGNQEADLISSRGQWSAIHMPGDETCAVLPEDRSPFPQIPSLTGLPKTGTHFCLIFPNTTFCCTHDCMWWLAAYPVSASKSKLSVGSCFPRSTVARPDFEEIVKKYYHRWDAATPEDNAVTAIQQLGLRSTLRRAGRMSWKEPAIHELALWVKNRVIGNFEPY
jgi:choline monooxygenase